MIHLICTLEPARIPFLPQFVEHYLLLGVDRFHMTLQVEPDMAPVSRELAFHAATASLVPYGLQLTGLLKRPFNSYNLRQHHDSIQVKECKPTDWILWADIDEFHVYPGDFRSLLRLAESMQVDYFRGFLVDRVADDGRLKAFDASQPIWTQYPRRIELAPELAPSTARKVPCARGDIELNPGNHFPRTDRALRFYSEPVEVHHFKWDQTVVGRLSRRLMPDFRAQCPWWTESKSVIDFIKANGGLVKENGNQVTTPADEFLA
ncbi:MAG: glycosyltransferase family 2 protein [Bryobacteraceae bacterium]|nr:glycosyltransferase family 2 protein [Bryobacteraceae bacterium]